MTDYYILDGKTPVRCDIRELRQWFETNDRVIAKTEKGDVYISTVFLGIDHTLDGGPPLLFETMIFDQSDEGKRWNQEKMWRYSTWDEAVIGHKKACKLVEDK